MIQSWPSAPQLCGFKASVYLELDPYQPSGIFILVWLLSMLKEMVHLSFYLLNQAV